MDMILQCVFIFINKNINGETWSVKLNKKEHEIYLSIKILYINKIVNCSITIHVSQFTILMILSAFTLSAAYLNILLLKIVSLRRVDGAKPEDFCSIIDYL